MTDSPSTDVSGYSWETLEQLIGHDVTIFNGVHRVPYAVSRVLNGETMRVVAVEEGGRLRLADRTFVDVSPNTKITWNPLIGNGEHRTLHKTIGSSYEDPSPAIALTILREHTSNEIQILTGERKQENNITHGGVRSTITCRIPSSVLAELRRSHEVGEVKNITWSGVQEGILTTFREQEASSTSANGHNVVVFLVRCLLAQKLGVAGPLEQGGIQFRARFAVLLQGNAGYPNLTSPENLANGNVMNEKMNMANIVVDITKGENCFPGETESYDDLRWDNIADFWHRLQEQRRRVEHTETGARISGLCIQSSIEALKAIGVIPMSTMGG